MEEFFWILIMVAFFTTNSLDKAESVQLDELEDLPLQTFDELFVDEWWDKDEAAEDLERPPTNFGQIEPNSTDQNPPLTESDHSEQIEHNSTDQNPPLTESDHSEQIEHNSTDQNPPLTESDHSEQIEPNSTDQNPPLTESDHSEQIEHNSTDQKDERKRKIIDKFYEIKDEFKQTGKFSAKEWNKIEQKIANHLKVNRKKIYKWKKELSLSRKNGPNYSNDEKLKIVKKLMRIKSERSGEETCKEIDKEIAKRFDVDVRTINRWKKEFGLSRKNPKNERKNLVEKFDQMKAELKRDGFKSSYKNELDKTVAKELGICFMTIYKWKRKLGQTTPNKHPHNEQKELIKSYYEIKDKNPKIRDEDIAKIFEIGSRTLRRWKKQFKRKQFHSNSEN